MSALITGAISIGSKLIDHWFPNAEEANKRKAELAVIAMDKESEVFKSLTDVVREEAKSEHFIAASWRPITMLTFVFIIANNYIIYPYLSLFFGDAPKLDIPPDMWDLLKIGLGGYVVGRSGEKAVKAWKDK